MDKVIPTLDANAMYKECLERSLAYVREEIKKLKQGEANLMSDLERLEGENKNG